MFLPVALAAVLAIGPAVRLLASEIYDYRSFVDDTGASIRVPANPSRLLALTPALTELLYALGLGAKVVGATEWSNYPPEAETLPRVGPYHDPNLEKIVTLNPDLVLAGAVGNPEWVVRKLRSMGIPVFVTWTKDPRALPAHFIKIGTVCGVPSAGRELAERMDSQFSWVRRRLEGAQPRTTLFVLGMNPLVSAGMGTITDQLIAMAGGVNVAREVPGNWPRLDIAFLVDASPEVILLSTMDKDRRVVDEMDYWKRMRGVGDRPGLIIHTIDPDLVDRPGPRLGQGLIEMAAAIHPKRFQDREDPAPR